MPRHPVGGIGNGLVGQVGVAFGRLHQRVTEQLGDGHRVDAVHGRDRGPAMAEIMKPQAGEACFVANAVPMKGDVVDGPRRRSAREEKGAIGAVAGNGVDDRAGGAGQPDRARPGLGIREEDALAPDPVPFERGDLAGAAAGQHQQANDGDDVRAPEFVLSEHGVEPGHFLHRQKPLHGLRLVAPGILAGVGVVAAVAPKFGHAHHHGQHRHGAVGDTRPVAHRGEPFLDLFDGDGIHGQMLERGQDFITHDAGVRVPRPGLPGTGLPVQELHGEGGHRMPRSPGSFLARRGFDETGDQSAGLTPGLGDRHRTGPAKRGVSPMSAHHAVKGEGARAARKHAQDQSLHDVIAYCKLLVAGLGGADAPGESGFRSVGHGRGSLFGPRGCAVVQEAAAAAFLRGSRTTERNRPICKSLTLQEFLPVHAMAGPAGKSTIGASGVSS